MLYFVLLLIFSVARNAEFVPPYGLGASMYIRPLLLGSGPELGLSPPKEFTLVVYVTPGKLHLKCKLNNSGKLLHWRSKARGCYYIGQFRSRLS